MRRRPASRGCAFSDRFHVAREDAYTRELLHGDQPGAQAVVHVVVVVGDLVGEIGELRLERGLLAPEEALPHFSQLPRVAQRAVLEDALPGLEGEVQAVERGVALLEEVHDAQRLEVVLEAAVGLHAGVQRVLAGVAERRMAEIVGEGDGLGQVLVEAQAARHRARDLGDLQAVGEARAEEIPFVVDEHLRLVLEPTEGAGMDDAVAVALVLAAPARRRLAVAPAAGALGARRVRCGLTHAQGLRRARLAARQRK